ncbi:hypothetical protein [Plantactinospora sp. GCM10030261]|uniref:hypothetical protein n=1 Tax=Plantactinospora sp. GCM10030261 TaxID=3273420 RepID=UPI0036112695
MRTAALSRALWGTALLATPGPVLRGLGGRRTELAVAVLRVLGTRHLAQGLVTAARPTGPVRVAGAVVDALHALTTVLVAGVDRRQRGPALAETGLAVAWIRTAVTAARR